MKRTLKYLKMHTQPHVPGLGQFTNTFDLANGQKGMTLVYTSDGVIANWKGVEFIVPLSNVANAVFDKPESDEPTPLKVVA